MRFIDRPLAIVLAIFALGSLVGAISAILFPGFREAFAVTLQVRMIGPVESAAKMGQPALFMLVFLNNSIAPVLSFVYPLAITEIHWTPPLTERKRRTLLSLFTYVSGFLTGFFGVGAILGFALMNKGPGTAFSLISGARIHAPLELFFVLVCIAEPLRLTTSSRMADTRRSLRSDSVLLWVALIGLLISAAIEVFLLL